MDAEHGKTFKRQRLGFGRACNYCRKSKNRCDGRRPQCLQCSGRNMRCEYLGVGKSVPPLAESGVPSPRSGCRAHAASQATNGENDAKSSPTRDLPSVQSNSSRSNDQQVTNAAEDIASLSSQYILPGSQSGRNGDAAQCLDQAPVSKSSGYYGDSSTFGFLSSLRGGATEIVAETTLMNSTVDSSPSKLPPHNLEASPGAAAHAHDTFHNALPQEVTNSLVDAYFERVHVFYPFLHEGSFRAHYEQVGARTNLLPHDQSSRDAVANLVFAYGCDFCRTDQRDEYRSLASAFIDKGRKIIMRLISQRADLYLVQALLLLCHYLQGALELNECWNLVGLLIRSAVSIGLHLNPSKDSAITFVEIELRKRLWWGCFILDQTVSMKIGRPPSIIQPYSVGVDLPLEIDDQYILPTDNVPRQPSGRPSHMSFFVQTIKQAQIIGNILSRLYLAHQKFSYTEESGYGLMTTADESLITGNAILLDGQLKAWWSNVPTHLKRCPDLNDGVEFDRQRCVILLRLLQVRVLLLRPVLLLFTKNKITDDMVKDVAVALCKTCVAAATETIQLISFNYHRQLLNSLWYNLHYIFTSVGVLVTVQVMEPKLRGMLTTTLDLDVLERGVQFLREASNESPLASRYVALLEHLRLIPINRTIEPEAATTQSIILDLDANEGFVPPSRQPWSPSHLSTWNDPSSRMEIDKIDFEALESYLLGTQLTYNTTADAFQWESLL